MLTKVEAVNPQGETLALPLEDISAGYVVKDIEGLDPVKASIVSSPLAMLDGSQFQAASRDNRNIVIKLGLESGNSGTSVRSLRSQLYKHFLPKSVVTLRFFLDNVHFVDISGRVESCEAPLFSREPELVVSVICFDPDFISPVVTEINGATVADTTETTITYPGTTETGIVFTLAVDRAVSEILLYNQPVGAEYQALQFVALLSAGDTVTISTVPGSKYARLLRAGTTSSILYGISPSSSWINLHRGVNQFRAFAEGAPIPFTLEYQAKYGGL